MDILIRGMKMPKVSGRMEAVITILKDGTAQIAISPSDDQIGYWKEYPLVSVQPHGRLIDADEAKKNLDRATWQYLYENHLAKRCIDDTLTVIPASEEET